MSQFPPANQPANPYAPSSSVKPPIPVGTVKNWLVESILVLICCCWPLGIVAIIYAVQVNSKLTAGDYQGAVEASNNAQRWVMIALVSGLILNAIVVGIQIMAAFAANQ